MERGGREQGGVARLVDELLLGEAVVAEGGAAREQLALGPRHALDAHAAEERVVLDALLPEGLAVVARAQVEGDGVLVEGAEAVRMQLDEELLALEAQLAYLRPRERVDLGVLLKDEYAHVSDAQVELHALVVLGRVHADAVELDLARYVEQVEVGLR